MKNALLIALAAVAAVLILSACEMREATPITRETEKHPVTETDPATEEPSGEKTDVGTETDFETETEAGTETEAPPATETESTAAPEPVTGTETEDPYKDSPPPVNYDKDAHLNSKRVLIDAGHGFNDPGCSSKYLGGVYEHTITYDLATLLSAELEKRGFEPVMLRRTDTFPSDEEIAGEAESLGVYFQRKKLDAFAEFSAYDRTIWANVVHRRDPVALMVSIHVNALPDAEYVRGTELYYCRDNGCAAPSEALTGKIEAKLRSAFPSARLRTEGCVWNDSFIVTKWTEMPSVLVETAYSTNEDDAKLLLSDEWREKYVGALADAIEEYMKSR